MIDQVPADSMCQSGKVSTLFCSIPIAMGERQMFAVHTISTDGIFILCTELRIPPKEEGNQ
jgi:hypothetical protein